MTEISKIIDLLRYENVTTRLIQEENEWDAIQLSWNELYEKSSNASPPLHFDWLRNWWRIYGSKYSTGGLQIVTVWNGLQLIGAMPLYIGSAKGVSFGLRVLRFISTGEEEFEETCPDYLDMLCLCGAEEVIAKVIWLEISKIDWDYLELLDFSSDSLLLRANIEGHQFSRGCCPIANISGGFEAYLKRLPSPRRQKTRYLLREGERALVKFEIIDNKSAFLAFDELMSLHQERWIADGKQGAFAAQRFVEFHRSLIKGWLPLGRIWIARLSIENVPIAVLYGFAYGKKFDFYQCGVKRDSSLPLQSPGNLANVLLIKTLAEHGYNEYDFLRGSSLYKNSLATCDNQLSGLKIWRTSLQSIAFQSTQLSLKAVRKGFRLIKQHWNRDLPKGVI